MLRGNVIRDIKTLLEAHGQRPDADEPMADSVAHAVGISKRQSELLLESLQQGATLHEAMTAAEIDESDAERGFLVQLAQTIGTALGRLQG